MLSALVTRLPDAGTLLAVVLCLVVFSVLLVYFDYYCRAMAPRSGTLEWIAMYDRPRFTLSGGWPTFDRREWLIFALFGAISLACAVVGIVWMTRGSMLSLSEALCTPDAVLYRTGGYLLFLGLVTICSYALLRATAQYRTVAILGAVICVLHLLPSGADPSFSAPLLMLSALLFYRWLTRAEDAPLSRALPVLLLSLAALWLAAWCDHVALWFGFAYLILLPVSLVLRRRAGRRIGGIVLSVLVLTVLMAALTTLPIAVFLRGMAFPNLLISADFWRDVPIYTLSSLLTFDPDFLVADVLLSPLLWWGGLLAAAAAFGALIARRSARALFAALIALAGLLVWCFTGSAIGIVGCALALGFVWDGLFSRGKPAAVYAYALTCMCFAVLLIVSIFI
jgi:hypothetical protein